MDDQSEYELVVGLEVHAQLLTQSKLFCGDSIAYGAEPNVQVSPISLGHPGTLPKMNRKAIEFAVRMGLACHSEIERENYFARKNYFYPDLPKGYQVSQHTTPICRGGFIKIKTGEQGKIIRLNRIHLEEDAGKSLHDIDEQFSGIDYNRAGTALIEIVTEPDLRSSEEAFMYVSEIRKLVRYLGICDGNMEEGSLRCDANISVRKKGDMQLGTKVEIKNLNSIRHIKKAIEVEAVRLIGLLEKGEVVRQQTRSFDPAGGGGGTTFSIRDKEDAEDYRYFAEPDLTPFRLPEEFIEKIRSQLPVLQEERVIKYKNEFGLSVYDAEVLTEEKSFSDYFNEAVKYSGHYKAVANWMLGPVKSWLNEQNKEIDQFPVPPAQLAKLASLVEEGRISFTTAGARLLPQLLSDPDRDPEQVAIEHNLFLESDTMVLEALVNQVLLKFAAKVNEYKKGKKGLLTLFVGEVMKLSKGKADAGIVTELLLKKINAQ